MITFTAWTQKSHLFSPTLHREACSAKIWEPTWILPHQLKVLSSQLQRQRRCSTDVEKSRILRNFPQICGGDHVARTWTRARQNSLAVQISTGYCPLSTFRAPPPTLKSTWGSLLNYIQLFLHALKNVGYRTKDNNPVSVSLMLKSYLCCHWGLPVCTPGSCSPSLPRYHTGNSNLLLVHKSLFFFPFF